MKRVIVFIGIIGFALSLSACGDKDEFGNKYDIENTDLEVAIENDLNLESVKVKYISYDDDILDFYTIEFMVDGNKYYAIDEDVYYEKTVEFSMCTMQYDNVLGEGYVRHGVMWATYQFAGSAERFIGKMLFLENIETSDYEIEGDYYKAQAPNIPNIHIYLRINSENYIDYVKIVRFEDDDETLLAEYFLSGHNNTVVELPESTYMNPVDYDIALLQNKGYDFNRINDTEVVFSNDDYSATFDFAAGTILFTKGSESVLYEENGDHIQVRLLLDNADVSDLVLLMLRNDQLQSGRFASCLEVEE